MKLAEAHGVPAFRVTRVDELRETLERAQAIDGPALVDVHVSREADVLPMVPAGAALKDMIGLEGR